MTPIARLRTGLALLVTASALALTACGGSPSAAKSPPPGPGDFAIFNVVARSTFDYTTKQYATWKLAMAEIGTMAGSARDLTVKKYADELKAAYDSPTTTSTTTRTKSSRKVVNESGLGNFFAGIGGYVGLKNTCPKLHP